MDLKNNVNKSISDNKKKGVLDAFYDFFEKITGLNLRKYKKKVVIAIVLLSVALLVFKYSPNLNIPNLNITRQEAMVSGPGTAINILGDENIVQFIENRKTDLKFDLESGKWTLGLGNLSKWIGYPGRFDLPHGKSSGLLKYTVPLDTIDAFFEIRFKSYSKGESINFVITFPHVYEIIIGDKDSRTVTLKRGLSPDGPPRDFVREQTRNLTRAQLNRDITRGSEVELNIKQELLPNGNMWVQIDIKYWHEHAERKETDTFCYEFDPPPGIEDLMYLHIGILKDETTDVSNSFELLKPVPYIDF